jgi:hypothetical protein
MNRIGPEKIRQLLPYLDSEVFSRAVFDQTGIFVVRKAIPQDIISTWQSEWNEFYKSQLSSGRNVNKFNPVSLDEALPPILAEMYRNPAILNVVEQAFGPDIALFNQRFVIKDQHSRGPVFLHQDSPYHLGWPTKASAFVALSQVTPENGGLVFYPGTHQFGYLGDAGEINADIIGSDWPTISPSLDPGDLALMSSLTWHQSGPHVGGPDRILADIIYQPANDPSGNVLLRGEWRTEVFLNKSSILSQPLFKRSRSSRLVEMQAKIEKLEHTAEAGE